MPCPALGGADGAGRCRACRPTGFCSRASCRPRPGERRSALEELKAVRATLIFFESGPRLAESLRQMAEVLGTRSAAVAREMTKLHEEVRRGTLAELAAHYAERPAPKGEVTLLVSPPHDAETDFAAVDRRGPEGGAGLHAAQAGRRIDRGPDRGFAQGGLCPRP